MKTTFKIIKNSRLIALLILTIFGITLTQCSKDKPLAPDNTTSKKSQTDFEVTLSDAQNLATHQLNMVDEQNYRRLRKTKAVADPFKPEKREIETSRTVKDLGEDLYHIVNYKEQKGFVIIAADKRVGPVLAYSDNSTFGDENAPGLKHWFHNAQKHIKHAKSKREIPAETKRLWEILEGKPLQRKGRQTDQCDEFTIYYETGRYVDAIARWWQKGWYNYYSPTDNGCNGTAGCNKKLAGCGPVAMGMVMRYHQYPSNLSICINGDCATMDYPNMPQDPSNNCSFANNNEKQVALLIRQCGAFTSTGYGAFGNCNTWTVPGNINNGLASFGYINGGGTWDDLNNNYAQVKYDLEHFYPVIFTGTLNIVNLSDSHTWVGDGYSYLSYQYYINDCPENQFCNDNCISALYEYIGLNWGLGGTSNGYYTANYSFPYQSSPGVYDYYDTYLRALTGIRKN